MIHRFYGKRWRRRQDSNFYTGRTAEGDRQSYADQDRSGCCGVIHRPAALCANFPVRGAPAAVRVRMAATSAIALRVCAPVTIEVEVGRYAFTDNNGPRRILSEHIALLAKSGQRRMLQLAAPCLFDHTIGCELRRSGPR